MLNVRPALCSPSEPTARNGKIERRHVMRRQKRKDEPTLEMRRDGARDVPSRTPVAAPDERFEDDEMFGFRSSIDASPESVRTMHAAMYRRLRRHMEQHREILTDDAWKLLTRVAFALYVDSREIPELALLPAVVGPPPTRRRKAAAR
jgi:hypothetical protein